MRKIKVFFGALALMVLVAAVVGLALVRQKARYRVVLADGSTFTLKQAVLTSTNFSYSHESRGQMWDLVAPILPDFIRKKIPSNSGSFGFGIESGATNLFLITLLRPAGANNAVERLRVSDGTNVYDACWGAHTLGLVYTTVNGWQVRAFPRRGRELTLEFLSRSSQPGVWTAAARFKIPNPAAGDFPQWTPGPTVQTNGNLTVRLAKFRSGETMDAEGRRGIPETPRKTEMLFNFEQDGKPTEDWRVQKVIISDPTGNRWFPYLNLEKPSFTWAKAGQVELFGALWPGETAWKLNVELVQTRGAPEADLFALEVPVPARGTVTTLTNQWEHEGVTVKFAGLASPNTDHQGNLKWVGKWWGEDKDKVYSFVVELSPELHGQRLQLVSATDERGTEVKLLEHRGEVQQAFFFQPDPNAEKLKPIFSLTHSRFVQFLARPEFVQDSGHR